MANIVACGDDGSGTGPNESATNIIDVPESMSVVIPADESSSSIDSAVNSSSSSRVPESSSETKSVSSSSQVAESSSGKGAAKSSSSVAFVQPAYAVKGEMIDERDGQTYKTVTIGTQIWMAENLKFEYNKGSAKSFCYNDDEDYCSIYGLLYTWSAAVDSAASFSNGCKGCGVGKIYNPSGTIRGICPSGWHLPSIDEWKTLFAAVNRGDSAAIRLKSTDFWSSDCNGLDSYGFSVLPAGWRNILGNYLSESNFAEFWISMDNQKRYAYYAEVTLSDEVFINDSAYKDNAFSVRCIMDTAVVFIPESSSSSDADESSSSNEMAGSMTDSRDGQTYKTVTIGTQTWMAENLAKDFVLLDHPYRPSVFSPSATKVLKSGYGFYYTWAAAVDSAGIYSDAGKGCGYSYNRNCKFEGKVVRGICPEGWHLPKQEEFETLIAAVSDDPKGAGAALVSEAERSSLLAMGTNSSGFSAVMTGYYKVSKLSTVMENMDEIVHTNRAYFWTINSTDGGRSGSYCLELWYQELKTRFFDCLKDSGSNSGMSIRCVMD